MDMKEASAMTEASGLVDPEGATSGERPAEVYSGPLRWPPPDIAVRLAERLRDVTVRAPLQALFVAFLLGVWVARRR